MRGLSSDIEIELLSCDEVEKFQVFIKSNISENHIFSINRSILDWQHKASTYYHYMIAKKKGKIVGIQGIIPMSQYDANLPNNQIFTTLWKVQDKQGIGIGLMLYKSILDKYEPELIIGSGMNPRLVQFHKWQGFSVDTMDHYVMISPFVDDYRVACNVPVPNNQTYSSENVHTKKLTVDDFMEESLSQLYTYQVPEKSNCYMRNRYFNHPMYHYDVYGVFKNGLIVAVCVIRQIVKNDTLVLRFVDYIGSNDDFMLVSKLFHGLLKKTNAEYCDFYVFGIPENNITRAGFVNRKKVKDLIVPNYFEPFKQSNIDILFGVKYLNSSPSVRFFKADGDQDRPSEVR